MAKPSTREGFKDYCLRQLGAPVLEINVDDDQIDDLVDDALQFWQERHFDGTESQYLKYKITQDDIDRGKARVGNQGAGITTTTDSATITGSSVGFNFEENSNFLKIPDDVIGVNKVFRFDSSSISSGMFSVKYQLFLNDIYWLGASELLSYSMVKSHLETIDRLLTTDKQIRFNKTQGKLYIDIEWNNATVDDYIIIDCYRALDPSTNQLVWNNYFLKRYATALIKRQWGQNLIKFQGVKLPGGIELNGRPIYDDAERELTELRQAMISEYELPPFDLIG
jgi:hypothetical protein|tara:strand:- start:4639 stop:5481 length:843 start_codon:yes stop_codon:yes gene_type:complete